MSYAVSFTQAPSQRLTDRESNPYWIEIRRGNDLVSEVPQYEGFTQAVWIVRKAGRRLVWLLRPSQRSWRVVQFESEGGYRVPVPSRNQLVPTWDEAVQVAESWRGERA